MLEQTHPACLTAFTSVSLRHAEFVLTCAAALCMWSLSEASQWHWTQHDNPIWSVSVKPEVHFQSDPFQHKYALLQLHVLTSFIFKFDWICNRVSSPLLSLSMLLKSNQIRIRDKLKLCFFRFNYQCFSIGSLVSVRKTSCLDWKYLVLSPQTHLEIGPTPHEK